jgi:PAS domain S-box-containing protein
MPASPLPGWNDEQLRMLGRAAALLASSLEFGDTLLHTISACLPMLGDFGFLDVADDDGVHRTVRAHDAPEIEAILSPMRMQRSDMNLCALSSGRSCLQADIDDDWYRRVADNDAHLALLRRLAFRSMIAVPMRYRGELIGALTLFMGRSGRRHRAEDLALAEELAMLAAPLVANARLLEKQRHAEAALRLSEERLRLATDAGRLGIWDWDVAHNRLSWSERVHELCGTKPGDFSGRIEDFVALIHSDDRTAIRQKIDAALRDGDSYAAEFRVIRPNGGVCWLSTRAILYRNERGQAVRMAGAVFDVTQRVVLLAAERAARADAEAARQRLELLASAGSVFSQSLEPDDTLEAIASLLTPRIADWCRVDLIDAEGTPQHMLTYHADPQLAQRGVELARLWRTSASVTGSIAWVIANTRPALNARITDADLERLGNPEIAAAIRELKLSASLCVPLVAHGRTLGALSVAQAESGRSFNNEDLALLNELAQRAALALDNAHLYADAERARREAELANRTKDEFLAMLGHELRNPLAPIVTALELMELRGDRSTQYEQGVIARQISHLSRLVDDLLDMSRIARGKVQLKPERLEIATVINKSVELARPMLEKNMLRFELSLPSRPLHLTGDAVRLTQVFSNLLNNAAKFTPANGLVELRVTADAGQLQVMVRDSGIGIPPELLPRVFERFVQGPQHLDRQAGGLGLGLTIAKTFVTMHGGSVRAESMGPGTGSAFYVRLPCEEADAA